jgi:hypothetical protein
MSKTLNDLFDLPSMEDVLDETDDSETENLPVAVNDASSELISTAELKAQEHGAAMDDIYKSVLKHANDAAELAFDLDPARAPRMLEVAGNLFKAAMDAKNSKRDAQLKLMKLLQDQQKLDLDRRRFQLESGEVESEKAEVVMVEDRNEILRRLRAEAAETKADPKS